MTLIIDPKPGESVYDPTCGSGGLLLNCALHLKELGKEYRTLKLYGQEINLITSSIARMNMFLHGIEEFQIVRGNTLEDPAFLENDELRKFNIILANPPYSIKSWNRAKFESDPFGRNIWGTPPQGCADYAFQQHIHKSLDPKNGRSIVLWPYGVLFRDSEKEMRQKMIKADVVDCVIALGKNLFYNSTMESCLLICSNNKEKKRKGSILFIDARKELKQEKTVSFLEPHHIARILKVYKSFKSEESFSYIATIEEVIKKDSSLNIPLYIKTMKNDDDLGVNQSFQKWEEASKILNDSMKELFKIL